MFVVNHIHLRSPEPHKTVQWYVDVFGAEYLGEGAGLAGSTTIRMDIAGTRINVSSEPGDESLPDGSSENHYGLDHFGFDVEDIEAAMEHVQSHGAEVLLPITRMESGSLISYVKGPDNVRIELVQPQASHA